MTLRFILSPLALLVLMVIVPCAKLRIENPENPKNSAAERSANITLCFPNVKLVFISIYY